MSDSLQYMPVLLSNTHGRYFHQANTLIFSTITLGNSGDKSGLSYRERGPNQKQIFDKRYATQLHPFSPSCESSLINSNVLVILSAVGKRFYVG